METLGDTKVGKSIVQQFVCELCDYKCTKKYNWDKHLLTSKHQKVAKGDAKLAICGKKQLNNNCVTNETTYNNYQCEYCEKEYSSRNGLWKHKKVCKNNTENTTKISDKEIIMMLIKDNSELKNMIMKVLENGTHNTTNNTNTTHTNSHNKAFNLNFFLNETCKDAMNISDFVSSIKLNLEDLENTGRQGYIEGISNIIVKNLNNLEQHMRPLHCSDLKREVLYIKDNNEWTKETDNKPILTKAIKIIANENIKQINQWKAKNPNCTDSGSRKNDMYLKIVSNSMNGLTEEEGHKNINKIISNIAKETVIQK
jgi:hypothetical protein